jgi:plastocyanin
MTHDLLKPLPLVLASFCWLASSTLSAASLHAELVDGRGQPLNDALLTLRGPLGADGAPHTAVMDQVTRQFNPRVLAVRTGTAVTFPNSDNIRHHVYSFSPAKRFELRLYQGTPSEPVTFDKPGLVVLGCNIHDWMVGYVYVTDDPWFAVADEQGKVAFDGLPAGRYAASLWHPQVPDMLPQSAGEVQIAAADVRQRFALALGEAPGPVTSEPSSAFGDAFKKATRDAAQ